MGWFSGNDYSKKQLKHLNNVVVPLKGAIGASKASSKASLMKALQGIESGFGKADQALAMQGALGTKAIFDRERQAQGQTTQNAVSSGLWGTSAGTAMQRGVTADTNQALAELNSMLAQIGSNIDISKGQAMAGAYGDLANTDQNYAQLMLSLGLGHLAGVQNVQYGKQGGAMPGLMNLAGQGIGMAVGGPAGAAVGGGMMGTPKMGPSDRRLKTNIVKVGERNGINLYEFDYIYGIYPRRWRGVMADEVEHIPGAVVEIRGFKHVDYDRLGFDMEQVA